MNSAAESSRKRIPKPQDIRLPPIVNSPTDATSPRPRLPPIASIHQLPPAHQSHPPRLQNVSNVTHPSQPPAHLHNYLDTAFQRSTERMQAELVHFRTVCSRALYKERQDKESLRMQCMSLMRERDAARETVRTLMSRNGDGPTSPQDASFPISPVSMSPTSAGADGRQAFSYGPHDRRSPLSDGSPDSGSPSQKRRSVSAESISGVPGYPSNPHDGKSYLHKKRRTSSCSISAMVNDPASPFKSTRDFVDLMYMYHNERLVCRACVLKIKGDAAGPPRSFPSHATFDDLQQHCEFEHPSECADLASLSPAQLGELRRRFTLSASSS